MNIPLHPLSPSRLIFCTLSNLLSAIGPPWITLLRVLLEKRTQVGARLCLVTRPWSRRRELSNALLMEADLTGWTGWHPQLFPPAGRVKLPTPRQTATTVRRLLKRIPCFNGAIPRRLVDTQLTLTQLSRSTRHKHLPYLPQSRLPLILQAPSPLHFPLPSLLPLVFWSTLTSRRTPVARLA